MEEEDSKEPGEEEENERSGMEEEVSKEPKDPEEKETGCLGWSQGLSQPCHREG